MKKVNKKSLPLRENSLPLRTLFCGQTASSLRPYGRSGQIICIGFLALSNLGFTLPQYIIPASPPFTALSLPLYPASTPLCPNYPSFHFRLSPCLFSLNPPPSLAHLSLILFLLFLPSLSPFASPSASFLFTPFLALFRTFFTNLYFNLLAFHYRLFHCIFKYIFSKTSGFLHASVDPFRCRARPFYLLVAIAMPTSLYRFQNLFKWTLFKHLNFNIYLMHKIILPICKNRKSHQLFPSKLMDCASPYRFYVDFVLLR